MNDILVSVFHIMDKMYDFLLLRKEDNNTF